MNQKQFFDRFVINRGASAKPFSCGNLTAANKTIISYALPIAEFVSPTRLEMLVDDALRSMTTRAHASALRYATRRCSDVVIARVPCLRAKEEAISAHYVPLLEGVERRFKRSGNRGTLAEYCMKYAEFTRALGRDPKIMPDAFVVQIELEGLDDYLIR